MLPPDKWYFKSNQRYRYMLEHVNKVTGDHYLRLIKTEYNDFYTSNVDYIKELCNTNDQYGVPIKSKYADIGDSSPTNLRYLFFSLLIVDDIKKYNLNNIDMIEIGGGYGGLCFFIYKIAEKYDISINSYTIFDLPEPCQLQKKYLDAVGINGVNAYHLDEYSDIKSDSFLVSTYAFSEIPNEIQKQYSEQIINPYTKYGFIAWNNIPVYPFVNNSDIHDEPERPLTSKRNKFVRFNPKC